MSTRIEILNEVKLKGKGTNLFNYQYVDKDKQPISAVFQGTKSRIQWLKKARLTLG